MLQFSRTQLATAATEAALQTPIPRVLSIAGTDPTGGAGTAADLKAISAAGGYAMAVTTAVVAQNTCGVTDIHIPPMAHLEAQLAAVAADVTVDAVKTGMLATTDIIEAVIAWIQRIQPPIVVVDPVMIATSGDRLLHAEAEAAMRRLCHHATVITPNIDELAVLLETEAAADLETALAQATACAQQFDTAVVLKTGHLSGARADNYWVTSQGTLAHARATKVDTSCTHGTGCSLSAALATRLARTASPADALQWTTRWLYESIYYAAALQVGAGHGPIDHFHTLRRQAAASNPQPRLLPAVDDWHSPDVPLPASGSAPTVAPVGPWTQTLWNWGASMPAQAITAGLPIRSLIDGSLPDTAFRFYLHQDACYLREYARSLAYAAALAPTEDAQIFFAQSSSNALEVEAQLHRDYLEGDTTIAAGHVTTAYTQFLLAQCATGSYLHAIAAILPCFWLYAHIGAGIDAVADDHPYAAWLREYSDPAFIAATQQALHFVEEAFAEASPTERASAATAFAQACWHEVYFFDQADCF